MTLIKSENRTISFKFTVLDTIEIQNIVRIANHIHSMRLEKKQTRVCIVTRIRVNQPRFGPRRISNTITPYATVCTSQASEKQQHAMLANPRIALCC